MHKNQKNTFKKASASTLLFFLVFFVSIAEPVATLPQVYTIWVFKQTAGVSLLSWLGYLFAACVWLVYGFYQKDKMLIISSFAWVITEGLVVLGLFVYR